MPRRLALSLLAVLAACQAHLRARPSPRPLGDDAEVLVYLDPLPAEAERLSFDVGSVAVVASDGTEVPLELRLHDVMATRARGERLLATGRVPAGSYDGIVVHVVKASLAGEDGAAALLLPRTPAVAPLPLGAPRHGAVVVSLSLRYPPSLGRTFQFEPSFAAARPERPVPDALALCVNEGAANVSVLDRRTRRVGAVLPTGGAPRAAVLDAGARRAYVAVAEDDAVEVLDLGSGAPLGRIRLSPGDRPSDLVLTRDGRTLLVTNAGSNSASFVDLASLAELQRVPTGETPSSVLLDRTGQRAFALDRRSGAITVLDVANRAVVATVATDPEPLRAAIDAAGRRLYVVHAGSPYLTVLSLPDLSPAGRVFVGLGVTTVLVDSRTDLVYVARADAPRLDVFDPFALAPVTTVDLPAPAGFLVIDDAENALWAVLPQVGAVAVLDLTSRAVVATVDVGEAPAALALAGARP